MTYVRAGIGACPPKRVSIDKYSACKVVLLSLSAAYKSLPCFALQLQRRREIMQYIYGPRKHLECYENISRHSHKVEDNMARKMLPVYCRVPNVESCLKYVPCGYISVVPRKLRQQLFILWFKRYLSHLVHSTSSAHDHFCFSRISGTFFWQTPNAAFSSRR